MRLLFPAWNISSTLLGSIPGLGRSPGEGKGYPLQYSGLENSMDCIVHGVAKIQTLSTWAPNFGVINVFVSLTLYLKFYAWVLMFCFPVNTIIFVFYWKQRDLCTQKCLRKILFAFLITHHFSSVQSLSRVRLFATPWIAAHQASLSLTNSWSSPRLAPIESVMASSHLILCRSLLLLPPIPPSIRIFPNESTLRMRWPN